MPPIARRPIREMSERRRHQGLSQMDLHQIEVSLRTVLSLLVQVATIPILALRVPCLVVAANLLREVIDFSLPANRKRQTNNLLYRRRVLVPVSTEEGSALADLFAPRIVRWTM